MVAEAVLEADAVALDGDVVVETDALVDSAERESAGDVLGFADTLPGLVPDVALVHPANAAAATSIRTVGCELRRFIRSSFRSRSRPGRAQHEVRVSRIVARHR